MLVKMVILGEDESDNFDLKGMRSFVKRFL